jgi:Tfp pilus assembly protein PilX
MIHQNRLIRADRSIQPGRMDQDERGAALMIVMMVMLMTGVLGVAALTMTGLGNSMAGNLRLVEEGTQAAESCVGTAIRVIKLVMEDPDMDGSAAIVLAPQGPVPALNKTVLRNEINGGARNNSDVAVGAGNAPNLVMNVNGYMINGDIDNLYAKPRPGYAPDEAGQVPSDIFFRVDCTAANAATGATSRVIAVFACFLKEDGCKKQENV